VATILIASTVLGASENDQIHFFYHFQASRGGASTEQALRNALFIAGRAILFATLINAVGFLALALSGLPPMRQFGIVASSAFVLSMLASLTVLPSALWLVYRDRPDGFRRRSGGRGSRPQVERDAAEEIREPADVHARSPWVRGSSQSDRPVSSRWSSRAARSNRRRRSGQIDREPPGIVAPARLAEA